MTQANAIQYFFMTSRAQLQPPCRTAAQATPWESGDAQAQALRGDPDSAEIAGGGSRRMERCGIAPRRPQAPAGRKGSAEVVCHSQAKALRHTV